MRPASRRGYYVSHEQRIRARWNQHRKHSREHCSMLAKELVVVVDVSSWSGSFRHTLQIRVGRLVTTKWTSPKQLRHRPAVGGGFCAVTVPGRPSRGYLRWAACPIVAHRSN